MSDEGTTGRGLLLDDDDDNNDDDDDGDCGGGATADADAMRDFADCPVEMLPLDLFE